MRTAIDGFGGIDGVVLNAGVASTGMLGELDEAEWRRSLEINLTAHFALTTRVWPVLREQAIGGSLVYVASKNAFAPGAGFGSYSVAKAGLVQLAKITALEGGPIGVRSNIVNPDAIFGDSRLWSDEVRSQRAAAHGVAPDELEAFYASRSLLGSPSRRPMSPSRWRFSSPIALVRRPDACSRSTAVWLPPSRADQPFASEAAVAALLKPFTLTCDFGGYSHATTEAFRTACPTVPFS